jgi:hypothetical protein
MDIISKIRRYLKRHSNLIKTVVITALVLGCIIPTVLAVSYESSYSTEQSTEVQTEVDEYEDTTQETSTTSQQEEEPTEPTEKETVIPTTTEETNDVVYYNPPANYSDGYDQAHQVWNYLKGLGLNDYVCAGIMGNIMAEVGGNTLDISLYSCVDTGTYYGICQWGWGRRDRLLSEYGTSLDAQLKFLSVELNEIFPAGSSFYNMQDEQEAALYFAKYFERCASYTYDVRLWNASTALEYFTSNT